MNKIVMLVTTLASTFYMGSYGMYALTQRVITKQPQSLMMHPGCMKWSSGRTMSTCMNHADEQEIQPQVLVETKSVEQMFPYLCKLGKNSPLLAVTRKIFLVMLLMQIFIIVLLMQGMHENY